MGELDNFGVTMTERVVPTLVTLLLVNGDSCERYGRTHPLCELINQPLLYCRRTISSNGEVVEVLHQCGLLLLFESFIDKAHESMW